MMISDHSYLPLPAEGANRGPSGVAARRVTLGPMALVHLPHSEQVIATLQQSREPWVNPALLARTSQPPRGASEPACNSAA